MELHVSKYFVYVCVVILNIYVYVDISIYDNRNVFFDKGTKHLFLPLTHNVVSSHKNDHKSTQQWSNSQSWQSRLSLAGFMRGQRVKQSFERWSTLPTDS